MTADKPKHDRIKLIVLLIFACFFAAGVWKAAVLAKVDTTQPHLPVQIQVNEFGEAAARPQDAPVEGCLKCHNNIEPMHKYNSSGDVYEVLKDGKDAQDLSCTS